MSSYGWNIHNNTLTFTWDSLANMAAVDARVTCLLKGYKYKTGCSSKRCSCRNKGKECSIGCDCTNTLTTGNEDLLDIVVDKYLAEVTGESTGVPDDANDIMDWVFGCEDLEENFIEDEQSDSHYR